MNAGIFGLSVIAGFFVSGFFLWRRAKEEHFNESDVMDVYLTVSVWALVASRLSSVVARFDQFGMDPFRWVSFTSLPGLDGVAALVIGVAMIILASIKRRWDTWLTLDVFLPAVMLWEAAILMSVNVVAGAFLLGGFLALQWVEREYRLWDWYRGRRGNVRPGLVTCAWALGNGFLLAWLAGQWSRVVFLNGLGVVLVVTSITLIAIRSGRIHL